MFINFNGSHSGGSSFLNINDCWLLQKLFVYHRYKVSSEKKKKKNNKESQYMVSHPETGSDSPIGSDRDRGRDMHSVWLVRGGRKMVESNKSSTYHPLNQAWNQSNINRIGQYFNFSNCRLGKTQKKMGAIFE